MKPIRFEWIETLIVLKPWIKWAVWYVKMIPAKLEIHSTKRIFTRYPVYFLEQDFRNWCIVMYRRPPDEDRRRAVLSYSGFGFLSG